MKTIKNLTADELRKSILQLAIQGKLVKQNPDDEPASELVKRIYEEKNKLIAEGKIKKEKNQSYIFKGDDNCYYEKFGNNEPVKIDDLPFNIPDSWMWIRLGMSCKLIGTGIEFFKGEKQYYSTGSIKENNFVPEGSYNFHNRPSRANRIAVMGELIDAKMQNTVKVQIIDNRLAGSLLSTGFYVLKNYINNIEYIKFLILSNYFQKSKDKKCSGTTQKAITDEELSSIIIPLPPLEEQQRIVDKINSFEPLLEKYDKVEKELSKLEKEFPEKLKRSILQYAIEGKLVNQDPDDEPASVLLERIKQEKERLIKEGKIKRDKNESNIYQGDDKNYYMKFLSKSKDYSIPIGWKITNLINISEFIKRGKSPKYSDNKIIPVIAQKCNQKDGTLSLNKALYIDDLSFLSYNPQQISNINDIIINSTGTGTVGRVNILKENLFQNHNSIVYDSHITTIRLIQKEIHPEYVYIYLKSPIIFDYVEDRCEGSTNQIELYPKVIMNYAIPIPPLKEQYKIVKKVNNLFLEINN